MTRIWLVIAVMCAACAPGLAANDDLISNGGFENGLDRWTAWGRNADLITVDSKIAHSGKSSARVQAGHNALCVDVPMQAEQAYEIRFFYRLGGANPNAQVALNYNAKGGGHRSAGSKVIAILPGKADSSGWTEIREPFMPPSSAVSCQIAFEAKGETVLWLDDMSVTKVARPPGLKPPPAPWDGLKHRTKDPLFKEMLTDKPGGYTMVAWTPNLNVKNLPEARKKDFPNAASWEMEVERNYIESARNGLGYMDLPGAAQEKSGPRSAAFHKELYDKYGVKFDVWTEGSGSVSAAIKAGAQLLNPKASANGAKRRVSLVDPPYVEAQEKILTELATSLRGQPFVGVYLRQRRAGDRLPRRGRPTSGGLTVSRCARRCSRGSASRRRRRTTRPSRTIPRSRCDGSPTTGGLRRSGRPAGPG